VSSADIERAVDQAGLQKLTPEAAAQFAMYLELLLKWNSKLNLTAIRTPEDIIRRHFVECIKCAQTIPPLPDGSTLLDFGSGAGFPGIPIAICRPEIRVTLAESQGKKAAFLREAVRALEIEAKVFLGRVQEMPAEARFTILTLRAVDKMREACRAAVERVLPGGWVILFATSGTESQFKTALPEIKWQAALPVHGLAEGRLLLGRNVV
jgi:16S rRNA (guanine527-N7)-methyltransferase